MGRFIGNETHIDIKIMNKKRIFFRSAYAACIEHKFTPLPILKLVVVKYFMVSIFIAHTWSILRIRKL